ncbi:hypothetical protein ACTFIY_011489 [Dictyostelium cf. discoideum]
MKINYILLLILLLIKLINCFNYEFDGEYKISEKLNDHLINNQDEENIKIWVTFNSKKKENFNNIEEFSKNNGLKKESIERRINRCHDKNKIIDDSDIIINQDFINQVLTCGNENTIKLIQKSNWLNSISISLLKETSNKLIDCIKSLEFVETVDLVTKFKKKTTTTTTTTKSSSSLSSSNEYNGCLKNGEDNSKFEKEFNNLIEKKLLDLKNKLYSSSSASSFDPYSHEIPDKYYGYSNTGLKQINVDKLHEMGYDGFGIKILITDTGYRKSHEVFKHMNIIGEYNFLKNKNNTQDDFDPFFKDVNEQQTGHGTFTLSTLGGYRPGVLIGAAYNASFLLAETENATSDFPLEEDNWIAAIEWGESYGAQLVSSSLGYENWYTYANKDGHFSKISRVATMAVNKGMVVVMGVGNSGDLGMGIPADAEYVISVGAIDSNGERTEFSSIGPTADGRIKPEVMALGLGNLVAHNLNDTTYDRFDGTSFSCPLVASGIALLMQAHPNWSSKQIYEAVISCASNSKSPDYLIGYGIFNALKAYEYNPTNSSDCTNNGIGCSNSNGKCNLQSKQCQCELPFYGQFCQYNRIPCGQRCLFLNSTCEIPSNNFNVSFTCIEPNIGDFSNQSPKLNNNNFYKSLFIIILFFILIK